MTAERFEDRLRRVSDKATPVRWWPSGAAVTGVTIVAGPHLGDTHPLFSGEWERCLDASMVCELRNHAGPIVELVAAVRDMLDAWENSGDGTYQAMKFTEAIEALPAKLTALDEAASA